MDEVDQKNIEQNIPVQTEGGLSDAIEKLECRDINQAKVLYKLACETLRNVNAWGKVSNVTLSVFRLYDKGGNIINRSVQQGDFIRIDVPGPGLIIGKGYDWVRVEQITESFLADGEELSIQVRPSCCPFTNGKRTAHFLSPSATSTFQVRRVNLRLYIEEHARNEKANLQTGNCIDNLRNAIIGTAARLGFSYPQWKSLVSGIMNLTSQKKI